MHESEFHFKGEKGLHLGDLSIHDIADSHGSPIYVYSASQIKKNINKYREALKNLNREREGEEGVNIFYAVKANRFRGIIDLIRAEKDIGIDACSPAEVLYSKECGFLSHEISFTGSYLSWNDLKILAQEGFSSDVKIDLKYGNKFGFPISELPAAIAEAAKCGLIVNCLHFHSGWNYPASALANFEKVLTTTLACALLLPSLEMIDVGGGLGPQHHVSIAPSMNIDTWAAAIEMFLMGPIRNINKKVRIVCEPGTGIVANSGILVAEVNTIVTRDSITWVGLNAGYNINNYKTVYNLQLTIVRVREAKKEEKEKETINKYHIAGHINESCDMFGYDVELPPIVDGDHIAFYPCGAYGSSMMSNHCMRGLHLKEIVV